MAVLLQTDQFVLPTAIQVLLLLRTAHYHYRYEGEEMTNYKLLVVSLLLELEDHRLSHSMEEHKGQLVYDKDV